MRSPRSLAALFLAGAAASAAAATIDVPLDEPDIAAAVAAAEDGDRIRLARGVYREAIVTAKSLRFEGGPGVVWDGFIGGHVDQLTVTAAFVSVTGIRFVNGDRPLTITGDDAVVESCVFQGCQVGVRVAGARARVAANRCLGLAGSGGGAYAVEVLGPDARVEGNRVTNSATWSILVDAQNQGAAIVTANDLDSNDGASWISVTKASAPQVTDNRIANCRSDLIGIYVTGADGGRVSGNQLLNMGVAAQAGIFVIGDRVRVERNIIDNLHAFETEHAALTVLGDDLKVKHNQIRSCGAGQGADTYGIFLAGNRFRVDQNTLLDLGGGGAATFAIRCLGGDGKIVLNTVDRLNDAGGAGILAVGDRNRIDRNRIANLASGRGVRVEGDDFAVTANVLKGGGAGAAGISVEGGATAPGAARIAANSVSCLAGTGIELVGSAVAVADNTVRLVGLVGIGIDGDDNLLERNSVREPRDDAFRVLGDQNQLLACKAKDSARDGFDLDGDANVLDACRALACAAEGLDNGGGTNTTAIHCVLKRSRIDYAGDGKIADDTGTVFLVGGAGQPPQID